MQGAEPCLTSLGHGNEEMPAEEEYEQDDVGRLREEAEMLQQQLAGAMERLEKLAAG